MTESFSSNNFLTDIPSPGSIIHVRGREWVALPQNNEDKLNKVLHIKPIGEGENLSSTLFWPLEGSSVKSATFAPPDPKKSGSQNSAVLLRDSFLLKLRAGTGPFRSLGNIAVEPRSYQLVPLLLALKQSVARLLIADEVGLGKTVEALLVAREFLDRGEIQKITVICPPHLCVKWKEDMKKQFNLSAEILRPGTAKKLEKDLPIGKSIFDIIPFTIVSLDWIKSDRNRESFLRSCGEFVIVDEAHTCAARKGGLRQQRYQLIKGLSKNLNRHLLLLTATPHSGDSEAFDNLLGLLDSKFDNLSELIEGQSRKDLRSDLGNYFVQRRRQDIKQDWGIGGADFPDRETREATYSITGEWGYLFEDVIAYAREIIKRSSNESNQKKRLSWWAALALLRCVSSSPAAAASSLQTKLINEQTSDKDKNNTTFINDDFEKIAQNTVLDGIEENLSNEEAAPGSNLFVSSDAKHIESLIRRSNNLKGKIHDPKLKKLINEINNFLKDKYKPIIFCRFRPTAHYLEEQLNIEFDKSKFFIRAVTGELPPEERLNRIQEFDNAIKNGKIPILIATDCLSEGIDLQYIFDAVIHYDLCWNPTRHEQREGRIDRFGQKNYKVRALMIHGDESNPIDYRVLKVILEKERIIRKELGVSVPIPGNANAIAEVMMSSILDQEQIIQTTLDLGLKDNLNSQLELEAVLEKEWQSAKEKAKSTRTIFAQRSLKPEDVIKEWESSQTVLGDESDVERFVITACKKIGLPIVEIKDNECCWEINLDFLKTTHEALSNRLQQSGLEGVIRFGFRKPIKNGIQLIGRSHPLVVELAEFIAENALSDDWPIFAARSSVIRTKSVAQKTQLLLIRLRYLLNQEKWSGNKYEVLPNLLVEECLLIKIRGKDIELLDRKSSFELFEAEPIGNIATSQREYELNEAIFNLKDINSLLKELSESRAKLVEDEHRRVREASLRSGENLRMRFKCKPAPSIDVIGLFILLPAPIL